MKYKTGQKVKLNMKDFKYFADNEEFSFFYGNIKNYEGSILEIVKDFSGVKHANIATKTMEYQYRIVLLENGFEIGYSFFESELIPYIQQLELFDEI